MGRRHGGPGIPLTANAPAPRGVYPCNPRQVGKTTLALEIGKSRNVLYLDLEDPDDHNRLVSPVLFLENAEDRLVIAKEKVKADS